MHVFAVWLCFVSVTSRRRRTTFDWLCCKHRIRASPCKLVSRCWLLHVCCFEWYDDVMPSIMWVCTISLPFTCDACVERVWSLGVQGKMDDVIVMMNTLVSGPFFPSSHCLVGHALLLRAIAQLLSGDRYVIWCALASLTCD